MIGYLEGVALNRSTVLVNGIGWNVHSATKLETGAPVTLWCVTVVHQNGVTLYGFEHEYDVELFDTLRKVPKVGPSKAFALIRDAGSERIAYAHANKEPKHVGKVEGVSAATVAQILAAVKRIPASVPVGEAGPGPARTAAAEALAGLRFTEEEIDAALEGVEGEDAATLVTAALAKLRGAR